MSKQSSSSSAKRPQGTKRSKENHLLEQADDYLIQRLSDLASAAAKRTSQTLSYAGPGWARSSSQQSGKPPLLVVPLDSAQSCKRIKGLLDWLLEQEHFMLLEGHQVSLHGPEGDLSLRVKKSSPLFTLRLAFDDPASSLSSKSGLGGLSNGSEENSQTGNGPNSSSNLGPKCSKLFKKSKKQTGLA